MLSLTWKRCSWRRSASVSCAAADVVTFLLTLLGRIGRHSEEPAPRERDAYPVLHVRGNRSIERAQKILRDRTVLRREDLRGAEPHVRFDRCDVLEDAAAEEPHRVPRVVDIDAGESRRDGQEQLIVVQLQPREERDRSGEVPERIDATG